jgi:hypothetical protein
VAANIEELLHEQTVNKANEYAEAEKQCRIHLAADWKADEPERLRNVLLTWNPGGPRGRDSLIILKPGHAVVQPLWRAQSWFGPFALWFDFEKAESDKERQHILDKYKAEKYRYLMRYGYPMGNGRGQNPDMTPVGPHRSPDVTVTVIDSEGNDLKPMRLHEVYGIGEFDKAYPLESFGHRETPQEVEARLTAELTQQADTFKAAMERRDLQFAELAGMVKGLSTVKGAKADG